MWHWLCGIGSGNSWWRPRQNGRHFADNYNKKVWILLKVSWKFVPKVWINNIPALVQIMAWRRPMMVSLPTHICVTRPQWVNWQQAITWSSVHQDPRRHLASPWDNVSENSKYNFTYFCFEYIHWESVCDHHWWLTHWPLEDMTDDQIISHILQGPMS